MTATDELRRMLDERGADYGHYKGTVHWKGAQHGHAARDSDEGDKLIVTAYYLTPEQAIAETLGPGTCEMEYVSDWMSWHCKACGQMDMAPRNPKPRYCKWCGRKVVDA